MASLFQGGGASGKKFRRPLHPSNKKGLSTRPIYSDNLSLLVNLY
jgi:hypothetical protein